MKLPKQNSDRKVKKSRDEKRNSPTKPVKLSKDSSSKKVQKMNLNVPSPKTGSSTHSRLQSHNRDFRVSNETEKTSFLDTALSTGMSVAKSISGLVSGDPKGIAEIPNSILKVVDTTKDIIRNVSQSDAKEKVVVKSGQELKSVENKIVIDKLQESMPIITTTQLPSSYATEFNQAQIETGTRTWNGRNISFARGSFAMATVSDDNNPASTRWNPGLRMEPVSGTVFGSAVANIALKHQMWRIKSVTATFVPSQGTDFIGNCLLNFMEGTDVASQYAVGVTYQNASEREHVNFGTLKKTLDLTYKGKGDWLYCYNGAGADPKWFSSTTFGLLLYNYVPTATPNKVGFIYLTFDLEFMGRAESAYNFIGQQEQLLFSVWLSRCRAALPFDVWTALFWTVLKNGMKVLEMRRRSTDKSVCASASMVENGFLSAKKSAPKWSRALQQELEFSQKGKRGTGFNLMRSISHEIASNNDYASLLEFWTEVIQATPELDRIQTDLKSDILESVGIVFLLLHLLVYFEGSYVVNSSMTFFYECMLHTSKVVYQRYHPKMIDIVVPYSDDESSTSDEEEEFYIEDYVPQ